MSFLKSYALPRIIQWLVVILVGTTVTFIVPRLLPTDPVEQTLRRVSTSLVDPRAVETFRQTLQDLYGLQGTPFEQYLRFWGRLLHADLGPSLGAFPTPVTQIIRDGLPYQSEASRMPAIRTHRCVRSMLYCGNGVANTPAISSFKPAFEPSCRNL